MNFQHLEAPDKKGYTTVRLLVGMVIGEAPRSQEAMSSPSFRRWDGYLGFQGFGR